MSPPISATSQVARRGLFATAVLLGIGLTATAWTSWSGAAELAETVSQGQAERFLDEYRDRVMQAGRSDSPELQRTFLEAHRQEGLEAIAFLGGDGLVRASAGELSPEPIAGDDLGPGRTFRRLGARYRVGIGPPPPLDGLPPHRLPALPQGLPPLDGSTPHDPPPRRSPGRVEPRLVLEFRPVVADALLARSSRMLALGVGATAVLVGAAGVFWHRARRGDVLAERLAQQERLASLGTMSAVLAHEIKNPLAALKGHAQLLVEVLPEGSRPRAEADHVVEAAVRLQVLVGSLLDFVRGGPLLRTSTDPAALLRRAARDAAPDARLDLDAAPPAWSLDAVRMEQALANLLRNAAQASPGGTAEAAVFVAEGRLCFVVRDDGCGLPPGEADRIFEPFYTTKTRGVGLGLPLARRVVELHGGSITAQNRPEGGAELRVSIPPA